MDFYKILCGEENNQMSLENLLTKTTNLKKNDSKLFEKGMIELMSKIKYDKRIATKYEYRDSGVKTIIYIRNNI